MGGWAGAKVDGADGMGGALPTQAAATGGISNAPQMLQWNLGISSGALVVVL
jgi:hypothetical protein